MSTVNETPPGNRPTRVYTARSPRVYLNVTQDIIDKSTVKNSSHCVIAEAVKEAFSGARFVSVDLQTIRFTDPDPKRPYRYTYLTPRTAQVALVQFDQGHKIVPFNVQLRGGAIHHIITRSRKARKEQEEKVTRTSRTNKVDKNGKNGRDAKGTVLPPKKTLLPARSGANKRNVPEVGGGPTPPRAALSNVPMRGTRRQFGIRSMEL